MRLRDRFEVRALTAADSSVVGNWLDRPDIRDAIEDEPLTPRARRMRLRDLARCSPTHDRRGGWMVEVAGAAIGFVHVMWIDWIGRTAEIDLIADPGRPHSAIGFIVIRAAGHIVFDRLNLAKAYGFVYADNASSLSPLRRLMEIEATMTAAAVRNGRRIDVHIISLTAARYRTRLQAIA